MLWQLRCTVSGVLIWICFFLPVWKMSYMTNVVYANFITYRSKVTVSNQLLNYCAEENWNFLLTASWCFWWRIPFAQKKKWRQYNNLLIVYGSEILGKVCVCVSATFVCIIKHLCMLHQLKNKLWSWLCVCCLRFIGSGECDTLTRCHGI